MPATIRAHARPIVIAVLTTLAMFAFAGNSILCRMALKDTAIDPASFSTIRLATGALTLVAITTARHSLAQVRTHGSWTSAALLFGYAACFSFAYVPLSTGTGALVLFSAVQATMILAGLRAGDRPGFAAWLGWLISAGGLVYLLLPSTSSPDPIGAGLMACAGVAWGVYSIRGRGEARALAASAGNFARALPLACIVSGVFLTQAEITPRGIVLASISGALTSGVGYVIWYAALPGLTAMQAALLQLTVPAIAALGGVVVLGERLTPQLSISAILILGGIVIALVGGARRSRTAAPVACEGRNEL